MVTLYLPTISKQHPASIVWHLPKHMSVSGKQFLRKGSCSKVAYKYSKAVINPSPKIPPRDFYAYKYWSYCINIKATVNNNILFARTRFANHEKSNLVFECSQRLGQKYISKQRTLLQSGHIDLRRDEIPLRSLQQKHHGAKGRK